MFMEETIGKRINNERGKSGNGYKGGYGRSSMSFLYYNAQGWDSG